ncbi:hypothetical protein V1514DRAFT_351406 [Lipomyces japonicus]|uniref:uncharacterized protein n=1 Tax=Lipomyces japonicus TaxID=56871 RepID=UPI0034CDADD7
MSRNSNTLNSQWTTAKCHRVLRPLSTKLTVLRNLLDSHPSLLNITSASDQEKAKCSDYFLEDTAEWAFKPRQRTTKGDSRRVTKTYSNKTSAIPRSLLKQQNGEPVISVIAANKDLNDRSDVLVFQLRSKLEPEIYSACVSIFHAFRHFLTQAYTTPNTLAQKSAISIGTCIVLTSGEVHDDNWYDAFEVSQFYKRFILLGHGVSLVAKDASLLETLMPCLILECVEQEAYELALILLRTHLECSKPEKILTQADLILKLCFYCKSSPFIVLQYLAPKLTVETICDKNFYRFFHSILEREEYEPIATSSGLKDMIRHVFSTCRKMIRRMSRPVFRETESALIRLCCLLIQYSDVFDVDYILKLTSIMDSNRDRFNTVWRLLSIHQVYLGVISDQFVDYFYQTSTTPSAVFTVGSKLREALILCYNNYTSQVKPIVERLIERIPKYAITVSKVLTSNTRDHHVLAWQYDVEKQAIERDRSLRTKSWIFDESIEEWIELEDECNGESMGLNMDNNKSDNDLESSDELADVKLMDEDFAQKIINDPEHDQQMSPHIPSTVNSRFESSGLLDFIQPPSSVVKLTPASTKLIREKFFKLLSTPASVYSVSRKSAKFSLAREHIDRYEYLDEMTMTSSDVDEMIQDSEHYSPLRGRKRKSKILATDLQKKKAKSFRNKKGKACLRYQEADELTLPITRAPFKETNSKMIIRKRF